jgi:hypothetical protein
MRPILVSLFLLLAISGCEEECATPDFIVEDPESQSYWGEWRYAYSLLLCDNSAPQGGNTYVVDTVFPGEMVTWRDEPIPTKTVIIGNELVVINNGMANTYCIYHGWYEEFDSTNSSNIRSRLGIYTDPKGTEEYAMLVRHYDVGADTTMGFPGHFDHNACGIYSYQSMHYYVKVH